MRYPAEKFVHNGADNLSGTKELVPAKVPARDKREFLRYLFKNARGAKEEISAVAISWTMRTDERIYKNSKTRSTYVTVLK